MEESSDITAFLNGQGDRTLRNGNGKHIPYFLTILPRSFKVRLYIATILVCFITCELGIKVYL